MYYVNKEARKLGMAYVGEIEDFLTYKTVNPTFQTALKTVKSNPEYYFMQDDFVDYLFFLELLRNVNSI